IHGFLQDTNGLIVPAETAQIPSHHSPIVGIHHAEQVSPSLIGPDLRQIDMPDLIGSCNREIPFPESTFGVIPFRRLQKPFLLHDAVDGLGIGMDSIPAQQCPNSTISISRVSLAKQMYLITDSILPKAAPWMRSPRLH